MDIGGSGFVISAGEWATTLAVGGAVAVGCVVGLFLILSPSANLRAARLLGALLVAASSTVVGQLAANLELAYRSRVFEFIPLLHPFAIGPLAYLYVRARINPGERWARRAWLHALLPGAHFVVQFWIWTSPSSTRAWFYEQVYGPWGSVVEDALFALALSAYLAASWLALRGRVGTREVLDPPALRPLVRFFALVLGASTLFNVLAIGLFDGRSRVLGLAEATTYAILVGWLAGIVILGWLGRTHVSAEISSGRRERYGISAGELDRHSAEVADLIARERMHLDPELTLGRLAEELELPEKIVSYVLNEGIGIGYHDYISKLRVDEARSRLEDPSRAQRSVLEIGIESGFNSKATFNRSFKRFTGMTPSEYRTLRGSQGLRTS